MQDRVLQVNLEGVGGAYSLVRSVERKISDKYVFDYLCMGTFCNDIDSQEIIKAGGRLFELRLRKNRFWGHLILPKTLNSFFKRYKYEIVHIHADTSWKLFLYALAAKMQHVSRIVIHSHATGVNGDCKVIKIALHYCLKPFLRCVSTQMLACSIEASKWMYCRRDLQSVHIIKNGVDVGNFKFSLSVRKMVRKSLDIDDKFVLGHVGDFSTTKNVAFLFSIIKRLEGLGNYCLLLVGDGDNRAEYERLAFDMGISEAVLFVGRVNNIFEMYDAMDVFLLPSISEAMPMSALEAQVNGLNCFLSTAISPDVGLSELVTFLDVDEEKWTRHIVDCCINKNVRVQMDHKSLANLDIMSVVEEFEHIYRG